MTHFGWVTFGRAFGAAENRVQGGSLYGSLCLFARWVTLPFRARMARTSLEIIVLFKGYKLITYVRERLRLIVLRFFLFFLYLLSFLYGYLCAG